jgi:hypothetical protein
VSPVQHYFVVRVVSLPQREARGVAFEPSAMLYIFYLCTLAGSLLLLAFRRVCVPSAALFFRWRVCRLKEFVCFAWAHLGAIFLFFWRSPLSSPTVRLQY